MISVSTGVVTKIDLWKVNKEWMNEWMKSLMEDFNDRVRDEHSIGIYSFKLAMNSEPWFSSKLWSFLFWLYWIK